MTVQRYNKFLIYANFFVTFFIFFAFSFDL